MSPQAPLRILVVDDEAPARRKILRLLREESAVEIAGEADGGEAAVAAIKKHRPDLVFLDVQMPGLDGFGVIQSLDAAKIALPRVVFITAHDRFALRAFEVHAFDYLLKPVSEERFREALGRARMQREQSLPDRLLAQEESRAVFVPVKEISWVEADRNYVLLHCGNKTHTLRSTLDAVQNSLDPKLFVPGGAAGEVRRREMLHAFAADRESRLRAAAAFAAPVEIPNNVRGPAHPNSVASFPLGGVSLLP